MPGGSARSYVVGGAGDVFDPFPELFKVGTMMRTRAHQCRILNVLVFSLLYVANANIKQRKITE